VATLVTKLLNIVKPDHAYFGEKDYQQLQLIRQITNDLHMPVSITGIPTVREADGLAMSSRNCRLTADDREAATALNRALDAAEVRAAAGPVSSADLQKAVLVVLRGAARAAIQSVDVVNADTLDPLTGTISGPAAVLIAVRFGDVLLIDQRVVIPEEVS
jgi:pantoate--beta-alanine ligase